MKTCRVFFILLLLLLAGNVFSQDRAWDLKESRELKGDISHGFIGAGESLFLNLLIMSINGPFRGTDWGWPTAESVKWNFTNPWRWEQEDSFFVNQLTHPYHGAYYFKSGRVNGFGFYESVFFNTFGSFTWEAFGESVRASINDFIATTIGGMSLGEIFYRLYVEASSAGIPAPLTFLISPMAGVHSLVTGWKPPDSGRNIEQLQFFLGAGYTDINFFITPGKEEIFSYKGFMADVGTKIIYGNPFEQDSRVPFRHFEYFMNFGTNPGSYYEASVITDGYLFSFSPVYTDKDKMSNGLSLQFDYMARGQWSKDVSTISLYSNALDWTIKYKHSFSEDFSYQTKFHSGFTFFGASDYYNPGKNDYAHNFGGGFNVKWYHILEKTRRSRLEASGFFYIIWTYPTTTPFSHGRQYWLFVETSYSHFVSEHISLGIAASFVMEEGTFEGFPDTHKKHYSAKMFIAWNL